MPDNHIQRLVEAALPPRMPDSPAGLYAPITYTLSNAGKRLRPTLLLTACQGAGGNPEDALPQAVGIEMFHNFTLLHDDVMDRSDTRRGMPTVWRRWNTSTAILSGDAMLTIASMYMMAGLQPSQTQPVLVLFNDTAMQVYEGQQLDIDFEQRLDVTEAEYIEMIRLKTAVLLAAACSIGAYMGGAPQHVTEGLYQYGINLGLAFQLQDDYLDTFGDAATFGKPIGGDIAEGKKTWLLIQAIARAGIEKVQELLNIPDREAKIETVRDLYSQLGLPEAIRALIGSYATRAEKIIDELDLTAEAREYFTTLARQSATRQR